MKSIVPIIIAGLGIIALVYIGITSKDLKRNNSQPQLSAEINLTPKETLKFIASKHYVYKSHEGISSSAEGVSLQTSEYKEYQSENGPIMRMSLGFLGCNKQTGVIYVNESNEYEISGGFSTLVGCGDEESYPDLKNIEIKNTQDILISYEKGSLLLSDRTKKADFNNNNINNNTYRAVFKDKTFDFYNKSELSERDELTPTLFYEGCGKHRGTIYYLSEDKNQEGYYPTQISDFTHTYAKDFKSDLCIGELGYPKIFENIKIMEMVGNNIEITYESGETITLEYTGKQVFD